MSQSPSFTKTAILLGVAAGAATTWIRSRIVGPEVAALKNKVTDLEHRLGELSGTVEAQQNRLQQTPSAGDVVEVVAGLIAKVRTEPADMVPVERAIAQLEARYAARETSDAERLSAIETRLGEYENKLKDVPSTGQIVSAMEDLLTKTMHGLDQRLSNQAHSIEVLKTTVSQTDELLERVLEALDSIRQPALDHD